MAKRLSRIERDIERLKEKISEYQQQLKELEAAKTEQENLQIIHPVRLPCQKRGRMAESLRGPACARGIPGAVFSCIYQLRNEDSTRDYRFEPYDRLQAAGLTVDKANYTEVYAAPLTAGTTLEDIYRTFNVDYHPYTFYSSWAIGEMMQNPFDLHFIVPLENQMRAPEFILVLTLLSLRGFSIF